MHLSMIMTVSSLFVNGTELVESASAVCIGLNNAMCVIINVFEESTAVQNLRRVV